MFLYDAVLFLIQVSILHMQGITAVIIYPAGGIRSVSLPYNIGHGRMRRLIIMASATIGGI